MDYIGPVSSAVMAIIWLVYLQLILSQYRRNNRPYLIFHHAQNENPDALCLLVNMGERPVHVVCVQAVIKMTSGEEHKLAVTEFERINVTEQDVQQTLRQGPLLNGGYLILGTFRDIIEKTQNEIGLNASLEDVECLELRAAVIHAPSKHPVGAKRAFVLKHNTGTCVYPKDINTRQMVKRKDKQEVAKWIESELHPRDNNDKSSVE